MEIFYTLLLYYRINYDPNNVNELLEDNKINIYYQKILFSNAEYFNRIYIPNSFIDEMLKKGFIMNYENLIIILKYLKRFENILIFLNKESKIISDVFETIKENKENNEEEEENIENEEIINLIDIIKIKEDDNINLINEEMNKLLNTKNILNYINIGQDFWLKYSEFFNEKNIETLIGIEKIIKLIQVKNKDLITNSDFIYKFIHQTGLYMSINHKFKDNIELLKFIKEKDIYYTEKKYKLSRSVEIFNGLNLSENNEEEFLKIWNSIDFIDMFKDQIKDDPYKEFQKTIISLADNIQSFHLLFKMFNYSNTKICNEDTVNLLKNKYISLIGVYNIDNFNKFNDIFIEDTILLIYLLDSKLSIAHNFIQNDLSKKLPLALTNKIIFELLSKFKELSDKVYEQISDFFTKNKENLECQNLVNIVKNINNINNTKCIKMILNKINKSMILEKNMIFDPIERNELKVFIEFQKIGIFNNNDYQFTNYIRGIISVSEGILKDIRNYNIKYNELEKLSVHNIREILNKRIQILNVQKSLSDEEINKIIDNLINYKDKIKKILVLLKKLLKLKIY